MNVINQNGIWNTLLLEKSGDIKIYEQATKTLVETNFDNISDFSYNIDNEKITFSEQFYEI